MARQNLRGVIQAVSIQNTALGEYLTDGTDFKKFPGDQQAPVVPTRQNVEDNMVGDGRAYPKQSQPYIFDPRNMPYAGALNSTMGVRIFRDWLGGAVTPTQRAVQGTYDLAIAQKAPGVEPRMFNILRSNGGESFNHGDSYVQTIEISQSGAGEPRISGSIGNSGHFEKLSHAGIDTADIVAMASYLKAHGVKSRLTFTDGTNTYDWAGEKRLIDVTFTGNQNVIVENLPGDSFIDTANECYGSYAGSCYIDVQSAEIRAKVYMNEYFTDFDQWLANKKITSVSLVFKGCAKIGLTTDVWELEIKIPIAEFNLAGDTQGNFAAYNFTIRAIEGDPVTGNLVTGRVRQVGNTITV